VRRIVARMPKALQPKPARRSFGLLVDLEGGPGESFQHEAPDSYSPIACATEHEGVARFKLP